MTLSNSPKKGNGGLKAAAMALLMSTGCAGNLGTPQNPTEEPKPKEGIALQLEYPSPRNITHSDGAPQTTTSESYCSHTRALVRLVESDGNIGRRSEMGCEPGTVDRFRRGMRNLLTCVLARGSRGNDAK